VYERVAIVGAMTNGGQRPRHRRLVAAALALSALAAATLAGIPTPAAADVLLVSRTRPESGPYGPITVIGDSVLLGSVYVGPTLDDQLVARGWGPVRVRAGVGDNTGAFGSTTTTRASYWVQTWRAQGWDPKFLVVNLGANDSAVCAGSEPCSYGAIMHLLDAIGPGHVVWWPKITRHPVLRHHADAWNAALDRVAAERPGTFFTWDWPTVMYAMGNYERDHTHLTATGYRQRSQLMADEITADLAFGTRVGGDAALPSPTGAPSELVTFEPVRVIDTRVDPPGRVPAGTAIEIDVGDEVPAGTTAVAAYVSATEAGGNGFVTAYECGAGRPEASSANYVAGGTRGAVAITPISPAGTFCLYTYADAHLLVDLQAAFVPDHPDGLRFTPLPTPSRLVDTRVTGRAQRLEIPVPAGAEAVAVSVSAIVSEAPGFLTVYPCTDELPTVATVNHLPGEVISGSAFVPVSPAGTICVFSLVPVDVTVDLMGTFGPDGALEFVPVPPTRVLDTRNATGGWSPIHGQFQQLSARVAPPGAEAVSGTITLVAPMRFGFLQAWGCGAQPDTANVTAGPGVVLANHVTTGVDPEGRMCWWARAATQTVFDTTGWWVRP
jgi:hypothetical protein